jgi:uncharacterized protein
VEARETHMSWVFLTDERVYKLKKPVRFPYLDFSTLAQREAACRAELRLNRRLAPDVYLDVVPLVRSAGGLAIGGGGEPVDWLVVMRRLDERNMLENSLIEGRIETWQLDRVVAVLAQFYRRVQPVFISPAVRLPEWRRSLDYNRRVLLDARLRMPAGLVQRIDRVQRRFLDRRFELIAARIRDRKIVDGHGDLRPEHVWLGDPVRIIDCIEFNSRLRAVDPFDEVAFLSLECERLGAAWAGAYIERRMRLTLKHGAPDELIAFYRCHRAMLRARLAIAHLLEPDPRTPEKWPRLARRYLDLAAAEATKLQRLLRRPGDRSGCDPRAAGERRPPAAGRRTGFRALPWPQGRRAGRREPYR